MNKMPGTTHGHKTLGAKWLFEPQFSQQGLLYLDIKVAPKSLTILYRHPLCASKENDTNNES